MVKIRVFIPHLELKEIFEDVVKKLPQYETIQIEQQYKHLSEEAAETGALVFIRNTDRIMEEERKIRKGLAEKGLTAK